MNTVELHKRIIAAARSIAPDERVPYAFEKRVMARLLPSVRLDAWAVWSTALWKSALSCVAVTLACVAWTFVGPQKAHKADFSQEFETAVFASASADETW